MILFPGNKMTGLYQGKTIAQEMQELREAAEDRGSKLEEKLQKIHAEVQNDSAEDCANSPEASRSASEDYLKKNLLKYK
jgi:hypothetical protein